MATQQAPNRHHTAIRTAVSAAAALLLSTVAASGAGVLRVDDDAPGGGLGTTWASACRSLQDALDAARQPGSGVTEIRVAGGVYRPDQGEAAITGDRAASFVLGPGITLKGGYAGLDSRIGDTRNSERFCTVLSGDLDGDDAGTFLNTDDNSYHVVRVAEGAADVSIDGFEIRGGNADSPINGFDRGGGMLIENANARVTNCSFLENHASRSGGGLASIGGSPEISHVRFERNIALISGAGMFLENGAPRVTHAIFEYNASGGAGGGIATLYSGLTLVNATFFFNTAVMGGAMWNHGTSVPDLVNVTMHMNVAELAGGLFNSYGAARVTNSILWGNLDSGGGGGDAQVYGEAVVNWSAIEGGWSGAGGTGNISADPLLDTTSLRLSAGSPAIDAGSNHAVPRDVLTDLAGNDRMVDDPRSPNAGASGFASSLDPIVDMGAYEFRSSAIENPGLGERN